jgi:RNA polymerase sigma-19 factor, ECF subfamily
LTNQSNTSARSAIDDRALLAAVSRGDHQAFDALFRAYYPSLVAFAQGMVRARALAEELSQDVMLELWRRRESLILQESLRAYLYQATRNRALNHLRHERIERTRQPETDPDASMSPAPDQEMAERDIDAAVRRAVAGLPPRCREVFEASRMQGLTYAEIATLLGTSVKTVEAQMGKALRILREQLASFITETAPPKTL